MRAGILRPTRNIYCARFSLRHHFLLTLRLRGLPAASPRTFIFRLFNFRDWDLVLREARKLEELLHENVKVMIFPDYSMETQRLRRTFDPAKAQLCTKGLKYRMLF